MSSSATTSDATSTNNGMMMEQLLGKQLLVDSKTGTMESTAQLFSNKTFVALYFSASWCPPCKAFSPILAEFYNSPAAKQQVEIVYVSSDHSLTDFTTYHQSMPWLAIPYAEKHIRTQLATLFQIRGIPSLIVLDVKTGQFITADARNHIQQQSRNKEYEKIITDWKAIPPVPIADGVAQNAPGFLQTIFMTILRNPMFLMAAFYLIKYVMRKYQHAPKDTLLEEEETTTAAATASDVMGDDEF